MDAGDLVDALEGPVVHAANADLQERQGGRLPEPEVQRSRTRLADDHVAHQHRRLSLSAASALRECEAISSSVLGARDGVPGVEDDGVCEAPVRVVVDAVAAIHPATATPVEVAVELGGVGDLCVCGGVDGGEKEQQS